MENHPNLKHTDVIPSPFNAIFSDFVCFNYVQSQVLNDVLYTDESLVISAPTGCGKTVLFELGIVKLLMKYDTDDIKNCKMVYISPIKSLCQERLVDWNRKFSKFGISCICVTGDSDNVDFHNLTNHNLIISTPEKWDSLTRKWRDNETLVKVVKLFMIDEVHLLNDDTRGSTLEVIVSRMKTVQTSVPRNEMEQCNIRFMAVSATIGNIEDIAEWIGCPKFFQFSEELRPVQLVKMVLGYSVNQNNSSPFKFDLSLNYRLQSLIIRYSEGKPTLIFCSTRKSVEMTARHLVQTLKIQINPVQIQRLREVSDSIPDAKIRESIKHGIGVHHAGMAANTRYSVEEIFREGHLPILVATSTLAMGVNLPAHLVIIKSTKHYNNGGYQDYTATALHQMIGRAGRPQFDTNATALILTTSEDKRKIEKQLNSSEPVESNLHRHLTEHLNAEVVLGTITGLDVAMKWLASTFLYIRATKNPKHYGLPTTCRKEQLDKKLLEMFQIDLNKLVRVGMITMDEKINVSPTMTGRLMARYYVDFETMKMFTQISGTEVFIQILALLSKCQEFSEMRLRMNDKKTLNLLNRNAKKQTIRYPLNGKIKTWDMKVNCIIQAVLGNLEITDPAIQTESFTILRSGQRIIKCLIDYLNIRRPNCYTALLNAIILGQCLHAKLWEDSPFVSKQLTGIGSVFATQLANSGKNTFQKILDSNPRDIELSLEDIGIRNNCLKLFKSYLANRQQSMRIDDVLSNAKVVEYGVPQGFVIKRRPPFGDYLIEAVKHLPRYSLNLEKNYQGLQLKIKLDNVEDIRKKSTLKLSSYMSLLVGNNFNEVLVYEKYQISNFLDKPEISKYINMKSTNNLEFVKASFINEDWVGLDCFSEIKFTNDNQNDDTPEAGRIADDRNRKQTSYIQTFLDIYMKIKKPDRQNRNKENFNVQLNGINSIITKQQSIKQKQEKKRFLKNIQDSTENDKKVVYDQFVNSTENISVQEVILKTKENVDNTPNNSRSSRKCTEPINYIEKTFLSEKLTDADLIDILDDHKIITSYKNPTSEKEGEEPEGNVESDETSNKHDGKNFEAQDEILFSSNDVQDYEEVVECNNGFPDDDEIVISPHKNENDGVGNKKDNEIQQDMSNCKHLTKNDAGNDFQNILDVLNRSCSDISLDFDHIAENETVGGDNKFNEISEENVPPSVVSDVKKYLSDQYAISTTSNNNLFSVSQKFLTDNDGEGSNVNRHDLSGSGKNATLRNILNFRGKKKRKLDDLHPAEILEAQINTEEENKSLAFKKPQKKKMHHSYNNQFPDSTVSPQVLGENSELGPQHGFSKNADYYMENHKSIKWRSPLVHSPGIRFSPKAGYKNMSREHTETESSADRHNESCETNLSSSSKFSGNFPMNIQKTPRRSKINQLTFKPHTPSGRSFPLSDKDFQQHSQGIYNSPSLSDIFSSQLLQDCLPKYKTVTNVNSASAADYFSQLSQQTSREAGQKRSKKQQKNDWSSSQSNVEYKENVKDSDEIEPETERQDKSNSDLNPSQILSEQDRNADYLPSQLNTSVSPNRSKKYECSPNRSRTRSEEYIESKIRDNYQIYPDFDVPSTSNHLTLQSDGYQTVPRCLPKASIHYSNYVDPVQFNYHPNYGQYLRPSCEYPKGVVLRKVPTRYVECEVRSPLRHNVQYDVDIEAPSSSSCVQSAPGPYNSNVETMPVRYNVPQCGRGMVSPNYENELRQTVPSSQRYCFDDYLENSQMIPTNNLAAHRGYPDPIESNMNNSFIARNPSYSINYHKPNIGGPVAYGRSPHNIPYGGYCQRSHPHPYVYVPENPPNAIVDKDYIMNKYWGSFNNQ